MAERRWTLVVVDLDEAGGLADRIEALRSYTAQELGADRFKNGCDRVLLVNEGHRDIIVRALRSLPTPDRVLADNGEGL